MLRFKDRIASRTIREGQHDAASKPLQVSLCPVHPVKGIVWILACRRDNYLVCITPASETRSAGRQHTEVPLEGQLVALRPQLVTGCEAKARDSLF